MVAGNSMPAAVISCAVPTRGEWPQIALIISAGRAASSAMPQSIRATSLPTSPNALIVSHERGPVRCCDGLSSASACLLRQCGTVSARAAVERLRMLDALAVVEQGLDTAETIRPRNSL